MFYFRCRTMQELVLTDNYISELPASIGDLTMLTNFNVDRNRLEYLPPQIGNLVNMGVFSLRENQLRSVPSEIGTCKELHVLDVSGNRLQHLPFTLTNLNLKALWLAENQVRIRFFLKVTPKNEKQKDATYRRFAGIGN